MFTTLCCDKTDLGITKEAENSKIENNTIT